MKPNFITPAALLLSLAGSTKVLAVDLACLNKTTAATGFVLNGIDKTDYSGFSVSSAGDVNGDGIDDIIIGATGANPNGNFDAGETYVVFGGASVGASGFIELAALNGTNGFVLNGVHAGDRSGSSAAGDVNGDGIGDIVIGAPATATPFGFGSGYGEAYVVFGGAGVGASGRRAPSNSPPSTAPTDS